MFFFAALQIKEWALSNYEDADEPEKDFLSSLYFACQAYIKDIIARRDAKMRGEYE